MIAELRTELSGTQKSNQLLSTNNRILVKQNDDLRNSNGLKSREEATAIQNQNSKLKEMVSKSSVEAVDRARAERDQAIRDKDKGIKAA